MTRSISPENNPLFNRLLTILDQQKDGCRNFLDLLASEKKALVTSNVAGLLKLTRQKEQKLHRLHNMDETIQELMGQLLPANRQNRPLKLKDLIAGLNQQQGEIIQDYQESLNKLRTRIHDANLINHNFSAQTLNHLNDAIGLICNGINNDPSYNRSGSASQPETTSPTLVSREA